MAALSITQLSDVGWRWRERRFRVSRIEARGRECFRSVLVHVHSTGRVACYSMGLCAKYALYYPRSARLLRVSIVPWIRVSVAPSIGNTRTEKPSELRLAAR